MPEKDIDNFLEVLERDAPIDIVITAHIHLENLIFKFLSKAVPDYKAFEKMDLSYEERVHFAVSLGLKPELLHPLLFFGMIRNKFAHNLDAKINRNLMDGFFNSFPGKLKTEIKQVAKKNAVPLGYKKNSNYSIFSPVQKFQILSLMLFMIISKAADEGYESNLKRTPL